MMNQQFNNFQVRDYSHKVRKKLILEEVCGHFQSCSTNACPLLDDPNLKSIKGDPETECKLSKAVRLRIGKEYGLNNLGLTKQELASLNKSKAMKKVWSQRSEHQKEKIISNLKPKRSKKEVGRSIMLNPEEIFVGSIMKGVLL